MKHCLSTLQSVCARGNFNNATESYSATESMEQLCALPITKVHFFTECRVCKGCFQSTAVKEQCTTPPRCIQPGSPCWMQEHQLGKCFFARARKEVPSSWSPERLRLVQTFRGRRVAVIGDSMARQSFVVLVSLLRGESIVLDTEAADAFAQVMEPDGSVVDLLGVARRNHVPGVHFPPDPLPPWGHRAMRAFGDLAPTSSQVRFVSHQCYTYQRSALKEAVIGGTFDLIVLHSPAYWPLLGMCGASHNRTADIVQTLHRPDNLIATFWAQLAHDVLCSQTKVLVVNAPTEKIGRYRTAFNNAGFGEGASAHATLEKYQQRLLSNTSQYPPQRWAYVDWASLMRTRQYSGLGANESDWHYACTLRGQRGPKVARNRFNYNNPPEYVMITPRGTPTDCFEQGNTALYRDLVLPQLEHWSTGPPQKPLITRDCKRRARRMREGQAPTLRAHRSGRSPAIRAPRWP